MTVRMSKQGKRSVWLLILISMIFLGACKPYTYPNDHEQLSAKERIVIRFSHIVGEQTPKGLAARRFAKLIKERSNGFVEVQVFPNGFLYKDGEEIDALFKGDIQMIAPATSKVSDIVPEWEVFDLPFAFHSIEEVHDYLESPIGEELMQTLSLKGFHPLNIWDNGFKQMTNQQHPLIVPEDFAGLRFRIMPSEVLNDQFATLKAVTQVNSFSEVFQLLEKREIDAQENTFSNIFSKDLHALQEFMTVSNHGYLGYVILMNKDFWEQLQEDVKQLIQDTLVEVTEWERQMAKELNQKNYADLRSCQCIQIHTLSAEEKQLWEDALQPVYQKFEDRFGARYIDHLPKHQDDVTSR